MESHLYIRPGLKVTPIYPENFPQGKDFFDGKILLPIFIIYFVTLILTLYMILTSPILNLFKHEKNICVFFSIIFFLTLIILSTYSYKIENFENPKSKKIFWFILIICIFYIFWIFLLLNSNPTKYYSGFILSFFILILLFFYGYSIYIRRKINYTNKFKNLIFYSCIAFGIFWSFYIYLLNNRLYYIY